MLFANGVILFVILILIVIPMPMVMPSPMVPSTNKTAPFSISDVSCKL